MSQMACRTLDIAGGVKLCKARSGCGINAARKVGESLICSLHRRPQRTLSVSLILSQNFSSQFLDCAWRAA